MKFLKVSFLSLLILNFLACRHDDGTSQSLSDIGSKADNKDVSIAPVVIPNNVKGPLAILRKGLDLKNNCIMLVDTPHGISINFYFLACNDKLIGSKSLRFRMFVDTVDKASLLRETSFPLLLNGYTVAVLTRNGAIGSTSGFALDSTVCALNKASAYPCSIYLDSGRFDKIEVAAAKLAKSPLVGWDESHQRVECEAANGNWTNGSINPYDDTCKGLGYRSFTCKTSNNAQKKLLCEAPINPKYGSLGEEAEKVILAAAQKALYEKLGIAPEKVTNVTSILYHPSGTRFVTISAKIDSTTYQKAWPVLQEAIKPIILTGIDGRQWSLSDHFDIRLEPLCGLTPCN